MMPATEPDSDRQSEARYRLIYQLAPIGIAQVCLNTGRLLEVNDKLCQVVGYSREALIGMPIETLVHPDDWQIEQGYLDRMSAGEIDRYEIEKRYRRADGSIAWVRVNSARMADDDGRPFRLSIVEDITHRRQTEAALLEREERLRAMVETAVDAIITITDRGIIDSVNSSAQRMFGYTREEMIGRNINMIMPEPDRSHHDRYLANYARTGRAAIIGIGREITAQHKDGRLFPAHLAVSEVRLANQRLYTAFLHDLTNRRKLEQLVAEASAREQQRIGQDLHDGLGQQLAGLSFFCKSLVTRLQAKGATAEADDAKRMNELISEALKQARGLARGLNPIVDGEHGLASALTELAAYVSSTFGVPCKFECVDPIEISDRTVANHAYRIAQEAVTNALKHAKPWNVTIRLGVDRGQVLLTIEDDGTGITPQAVQAGNGREIMRARAAYIGGSVDITPGETNGTVVRCRFPHPPLKEVDHVS